MSYSFILSKDRFTRQWDAMISLWTHTISAKVSYPNNLEIVHNFKSNDATSALPYCGLGSCLYHAEEYEYSLRCFLKAKEIR